LVSVTEGVKNFIKLFFFSLLNNGADPSLTCGPQAFSALHLSAGSTEGTLCCELLLKAGCNVGQRSADGSTALHYACEFGRIARTKMLVEKGASVNELNADGISPLHVAARFGHDIITKFLLDSGANVNLLVAELFLIYSFVIGARILSLHPFFLSFSFLMLSCGWRLQTDELRQLKLL
uniref:ANK_REP_REGION domain-containing protein n=1 Tax=Toxocara canis TaxID=6265 RepID=A0A183U7Q2_TOXCA